MKTRKDRNLGINFVVLALLFVVAGVVAFASDRNHPTEPASFSVGITSMMVAAPRLVKAKDWALGTVYAQGDLVRSTAHTARVYWNATVNAGAATTNPDHLNDDVADGDITWRRIVPTARKAVYVVNGGSNAVWIAVGRPAVVDSGVKLLAGGSFWEDVKLQDSIHAISDGTTNNVSTQEF